MIVFDDTYGEKLYNMAADMDSMNYDGGERENSIELLNSALSKVYSYASWNDDFLELWCALDMILDNK